MTTPKLTSSRTSDSGDMCIRASDEPLLRPEAVAPSDPRLQVIGVFNPAVWKSPNWCRLIVRVDERPRTSGDYGRHLRGRMNIPVARIAFGDGQPRIELLDIEVGKDYVRDSQAVLPNIDAIETGPEPLPLLSHISHLRIAEYSAGTWNVHSTSLVSPSDSWSEFGCEDPRVTNIDGESYLTYSAISRFGATAWVAQLNAQGKPLSKRMVLGPDHKHALLLPERVKEHYWLFVRPLVRSWIHEDGIWIYRSRSLEYWGQPTPLLMPRAGHWDALRVGPSATPLRIPEGWLLFYYGVDTSQSYHVGAAVLKYSDPSVVLSRTEVPILSPTLTWERTGRRADTVFCCGAMFGAENTSVHLYYGAADTYVGAAEISLSALRAALRPTVDVRT